MPEAPKPAPKPAPAPGAKPEGEEKPKARRSQFSTLYPEDQPIKLLVKENPKKAGSKSAARFEGYNGAKTVGDALANGVTYQDIAYDVGRGFIQVG